MIQGVPEPQFSHPNFCHGLSVVRAGNYLASRAPELDCRDPNASMDGSLTAKKKRSSMEYNCARTGWMQEGVDYLQTQR
jgi:hypothetical protein